VPIGGIIYRSAIIEALFVPNVIDVALSAPATDVTLSSVQAAQFNANLTWIEV
jgi:phage-related baseplate assembly protein